MASDDKPPGTIFAADDTAEKSVAEQPRVSKHGKTTGEKFYDVVQFTIGVPVILAATAGIAFLARYGKDSYGPVPNILKSIQSWMEKALLTNKIFPLGNKGDFFKRFAGAAANTTVLVHGGNLFSPIMKWMENSKERIATFANRRWGKPGEVEEGHARMKDLPKQSWGDIIKGRLLSWVSVFGAFLTMDTVLGKNKAGQYRLDNIENSFGKFFANTTSKGRDAMHAGTQENNSLYRLGKIVALDIYATVAAMALWGIFSRGSARRRQEQENRHVEKHDAGETVEETLLFENPQHDKTKTEKKPSGHSERAPQPTQDYRARTADAKSSNPFLAIP